MTSNPLQRLKALGQSPWLDWLDRSTVRDGGLRRMMVEDAVCGVTSNPTILARALTTDPEYRQAIARLRPRCRSTQELYEALVLEDIRLAADVLRPAYDASGGGDGFVSLEVSPELADDARATVTEATRLWWAIDRPNAMIKVPATAAGLEAIEALTMAGINVNVTLIFSPERYAEVAEAWLTGVEHRLANGGGAGASVASFFVSRIDTLIDRELDATAGREPAARALRGRVAVAAAALVYERFQALTGEARWRALAERGVRPQRPLWASTSTKDPAYPDVKYVEALVAPQTVTTLPPPTLEAYRDHGDPAPRLAAALDEAHEVFAALARLGLDYRAAAARLEREGVTRFAESHHALLAALEDG